MNRHLLLLGLFVLTSLSLFSQEETFRKYYGIPYNWAVESGFSVEQTGEDDFVLIGTRENAESLSTDIAFWTFGRTGGFIDSSAWILPGDQQILETFGGPDGGYLIAYYAADAFERDTVNLAYFNPDGSLSWNQPLVDFDDLRDGIRGVDFISPTEVVIAYAGFGRFPETATKVATVSASEGLVPGFTYRGIDFAEIWSLERQPDGNLLMAGDVGFEVFVTMVKPDGETVWQQAFERTEDGFNRSYEFLSAAHRPVGDTVVLVTGLREDGRGIIVMDTLGNRLEEYVVPDLFRGERRERATWYGRTKLFVNNPQDLRKYFQLIETVDYSPTQDYAEGYNSFDGISLQGSLYLEDQDVVLSAVRRSENQGFSRYNNTNATFEAVIGGTLRVNTDENALGIAALPDGKFLLQTYSPDANDSRRTQFWTTDSLGDILSQQTVVANFTNIQTAKDGNFLLSYSGFRSMTVIKADAGGTQLWRAELSGNTLSSIFSPVADLGHGEFAWSETDISRDNDFIQFYRTRIVYADSTGAELNAFLTNRTGEILSMAADQAGNLIVSGSTYALDSSLVVSYDLTTGEENWRYTYQVPDFGYGAIFRLLPLPDGSIAGLNLVRNLFSGAEQEVELDFITLDATGAETGRVPLESGAFQVFGPQLAQKENGTATVVFGYDAFGDDAAELLRIKEIDPASMTLTNAFELSSPYGNTTPAGIAFPDEERTAVVATAAGSDTSFSNDVLFLIFDAEGNITDIRGQEVLPLEISLSPNPTPDVLRITTAGAPGTGTLYIQLFDVTGRQLIRQEFGASNQTEVDLSAFTAGTYFLLVRDEKGRSISRKVVKL